MPRASVSSAPPPFTMMPRLAAREIPATIAIGAARISGHGVATTSTASARTGSPLRRPRGAGDRERDRDEDQRRSGRPGGRTGAFSRLRRLAPGGRCPRRCSRPRSRSRAGRTPAPAFTAPARTWSPRGRSTGPRLAGERRLVEHGASRLEHAVDRARPRPSSPAAGRRGATSSIGDRLERAVLVAVGGARRAREERRQLAVRPARRRRPPAHRPVASINAITAPARYSPSASAPTIARTAIRSTPGSRCAGCRAATSQPIGTMPMTVVIAQATFGRVRCVRDPVQDRRRSRCRRSTGRGTPCSS